MPGPVPSSSPVRNLKDLRAAIRHGEAVTVRRVNSAVVSRVATAVAAVQSLTMPPATNPKSAAWQRVQQRSDLARDATRVTAAVAGIAAAVFFTGEVITTAAMTLLSLMPAVVILAKSAECSALLHALRLDARRVELLRKRVEVRRHWLTTVGRASKILSRALANPHGLYETPHFGTDVRVMRRRQIKVDDVVRLEEALLRARNVEQIITEPRSRTGVDLSETISLGWSTSVFYTRRILAAFAVLALANTTLLAFANQSLGAVVSGLACSALLGARYFISAWEAKRVDFTIRRLSMRLRYTDFMTELDHVIQEEIDKLIAVYTTGLDVEIDPFEDLEPQLRRQIDVAIAYGTENERQMHDVLDLRALRDSYRPSSN